MAILHLSSSGLSGAGAGSGSSLTQAQLAVLLNNYPYQIKLIGGVASTSQITGQLVVTGGIGVNGNIYLTNLVAISNVSATNAAVTNQLTAGVINSLNLYNTGYIQSTSGYIDQLSSAIFTANIGNFTTVNVSGSVNADAATVNSAAITALTAGSASISTTTSSNIYTRRLYVDNMAPWRGSQINLGYPAQLAISGGEPGNALTTDGDGNLVWASSASNISVGPGLIKEGDVISLDPTGISPGTYTQVTVNAYGQAVSGAYVFDTLAAVTGRGSATPYAIHFTNEDDSGDINQGALVVDGGLGVGKTITATDVVVQNTLQVNSTLTVYSNSYLNRTVALAGGANGVVPLLFSAAAPVGTPAIGAIEFDGDTLYVSTNAGRQEVVLRQAGQPASPTVLVRAAATTNIDIANPPDQIDTVGLGIYDRIVLTQQSDRKQNGVYVFFATNRSLVRSSDQNASSGIYSGTVIFVAEGTVYGGSSWRIETAGVIIPDSTQLLITQTGSLDTMAIAKLPKNTSAGLITRTTYGNVVLRSLVSTSSFVTVANASGDVGDITISTGILAPVAGGTGRAGFFGYLRGLGNTTTSSNTIPISSVTGVGTMATQNANAVAITGGTISVGNLTVTGNFSIGGTKNGTIASQDASNVAITGGNIDGVVIGSTTASTGRFSTLNTTGDAVIGGNLTVHGATTVVDSSTVSIGDLNIELAKGSNNASQSDGGGLTVNLGINGAATFNYGSASDAWNSNKPIKVSGVQLLNDADTIDGGTY